MTKEQKKSHCSTKVASYVLNIKARMYKRGRDWITAQA